MAGLGDGLGMISVYVCVWWGHGSDLYILGWQKLMGKRGNVRVGTDTLGSEKLSVVLEHVECKGLLQYFFPPLDGI